MHIEVVAIGDEILKGMTTNTNAAFISRSLYEKGYQVAHHMVVPDDPQVITRELSAALGRSHVIIATGGLGSTLDDHTRRTVEELFDPAQAEPILNPIGMAPGLVFTKGKTMLVLMPGVPHEMQVMFTQKVLPLIQAKFPVSEKKEHVQLHLCLVPESAVDPSLREWKEKYPRVDVGIYPACGAVTVHLASEDKTQLAAFRQSLAQRFAHYLFPSSTIAEAIFQWFTQNGKRLALAESCTGGTIASLLTAVPGCSAYFLGSFVTYCDALKMNVLQVPAATLKQQGAVSEETVRAMLLGVFEVSAADVGIAVSGIAGPTGGSEDKPVGTVWAAIGLRGEAPDVGKFVVKGDRQKIISVSANYVLGALWRKAAHHIAAFPLY